MNHRPTYFFLVILIVVWRACPVLAASFLENNASPLLRTQPTTDERDEPRENPPAPDANQASESAAAEPDELPEGEGDAGRAGAGQEEPDGTSADSSNEPVPGPARAQTPATGSTSQPRDRAPGSSRERPGTSPRGASDRRNRNASGEAARPGARTRSATNRSSANPPGLTGSKSSSENASTNYSRFKIITDRNIFNASRSSRDNRARNENRKSTAVETFTLVGILADGEKAYAFFDGSSSPFKKVLERGKEIAGYTVVSLAPDLVRLEADSKTVEMRVGMQMRRQDNGWEMVAGTLESRRTSGSSASPEDSSNGEGDDVIQRLMRQREQELK